jgi:hypothetical protein
VLRGGGGGKCSWCERLHLYGQARIWRAAVAVTDSLNGVVSVGVQIVKAVLHLQPTSWCKPVAINHKR